MIEDWHWQLAHTLGARDLGFDPAALPFPCRGRLGLFLPLT